ncbi:MAG: HD domain-containing protein [Treponema sp.]|jgi:exopolyphosphatase/guanosine-5'-triphosphate,3'-diphosphate pyrophosphatase|nr:HD domain-containing protein [Treponema sp.]
MKNIPATHLEAILEIGSTGIRLLVAEIAADGSWREVDRAEKPVSLGRDVFASGKVSRESFLECLAVLQRYKELLASWQIHGVAVHAIATSALRAARNRDIIVDRVRQETGFRIDIVEGVEENRLMYLAVRFALKQDLPQFWQSSTMIIDIGGGSTEIMLLRRGKMVAAHSLRVGTIIIDEQSRHAGRALAENRYVNEQIRHTTFFFEMDMAQVNTLVATGLDARVAARLIGTELNERCRFIERERFIEFVREIQHYTMEESVRKLLITYNEAEGFVSGLLVYREFLEQTAAARIVVPDVTIREGLLIDLALGVDQALHDEFCSQIIASAANLGKKYHYDEAHSRAVANLALMLFDALVHEHGMGARERRLLEVAAMLHDIGKFIGVAGHHKHGAYIVAHSEVFGLQREELNLIAGVIRYHRGEASIAYHEFHRSERVLVLKLVSMLRVADALDCGHSLQIKQMVIERKPESIVLHTRDNHDLSLERRGLEEKADLFQDVFGYKVVLV